MGDLVDHRLLDYRPCTALAAWYHPVDPNPSFSLSFDCVYVFFACQYASATISRNNRAIDAALQVAPQSRVPTRRW